MKKPPVPVVAAIIRKNDLILIAQRPKGKALAGKWEFPGGKLEKGESPETALRREIMEELGCTLQITKPLSRFRYAYPEVEIDMIPMEGILVENSPAPHPHEHSAIAWVREEDLQNYDLAAADLPIVREILSSHH